MHAPVWDTFSASANEWNPEAPKPSERRLRCSTRERCVKFPVRLRKQHFSEVIPTATAGSAQSQHKKHGGCGPATTMLNGEVKEHLAGFAYNTVAPKRREETMPSLSTKSANMRKRQSHNPPSQAITHRRRQRAAYRRRRGR